MKLFGRLLLIALLAGFTAALVLVLAQRWLLLPLLLEAENYTSAARFPDTFEIMHAFGQHRAMLLALANLAISLGYGLLLVAAMSLRGASGALRGLLWGLAAYVVVAVIPAATLGAGLPGEALADLSHRQWWWLFSATTAAVGLALAAFAGQRRIRLAGALLTLLPLLVGAPHTTGESFIPEQLAQDFRIMRYLTNLIFWLVLGLLTGYLLAPRKPA